MRNTLTLAIFALALSACDPFSAVHEACMAPKDRATAKKLTMGDVFGGVNPWRKPAVPAWFPAQPGQTVRPTAQAPAATQVPTYAAPAGSLSSMLYRAALAEGTPVEVLYAVKRNETGKRTGKGTNLGSCNAREQLQIFCHHNKSACQHLTALEKMADIHGWDLAKLNGSCASSTWTNNTKEHGGAIGEMQTLPAYFFKGKYGKKDPFNPEWAMHHAASVLKAYHDESSSKDVYKKWEWAIRRYRGMPTGEVSKNYYDLAVSRWQTATRWHRQGIFALCVDNPGHSSCDDGVLIAKK